MKPLPFVLLPAIAFSSTCVVHAADPFTPPDFPAPVFKEAKFNVRDFGAKGDSLH